MKKEKKGNKKGYREERETRRGVAVQKQKITEEKKKRREILQVVAVDFGCGCGSFIFFFSFLFFL